MHAATLSMWPCGRSLLLPVPGLFSWTGPLFGSALCVVHVRTSWTLTASVRKPRMMLFSAPVLAAFPRWGGLMSKKCTCPAVLHYRAASARGFPTFPAAAVSYRAFGRSLPLFCPRPWLIRQTTTYLLTSSFQRKRKRALAAADTAADAALSVPGSAMSDTFAVPGRRLGYVGRSAGGRNDTGGGSGVRFRLIDGGGPPPGTLYQPHYSGSGNQWSGYASSSPAVPMPSVLVRSGASDGQLLDGLSFLAPDIRQRLLTILHAMEHRQVGQARVVLASPPGLPLDAPSQSCPGRNPPSDPTPKRRAFPEAQDFCTIACRVPGCDRLCGRPFDATRPPEPRLPPLPPPPLACPLQSRRCCDWKMRCTPPCFASAVNCTLPFSFSCACRYSTAAIFSFKPRSRPFPSCYVLPRPVCLSDLGWTIRRHW